MRPAYRSRKVVLQSMKPQQAKLPLDQKNRINGRNVNTPSRFPPNRIILRNARAAQQSNNPHIKAHTNHGVGHQRPGSHSETGDDPIYDDTEHITSRTEGLQSMTPEEFLEARDRRTIMRYGFVDKKFQIQKERTKLSEWLGQMHFRVVSTSFNLYLSNALTFEEVKVHCCENLLLNILNFLENLTKKSINPHQSGSLGSTGNLRSRIHIQSLGHLELTDLLKQINSTLIKNLSYMQIKYPVTKDSKPNKALQSMIFKINNLGNDEHDMVMKSNVNFKLKKEGNYTPEIMKFLNYLIVRQSELSHVKGRANKQLTYFEFFYETMEALFTSVYKPQSEKKQANNKRQDEQAVHIFANIMSSHQIQQDDQIYSKEQKEYKEKVMKYTHYKIGKKINSNTELYSDKQIQTEIFDVRNSSILRLLTKWTEQLQKKIVQCEQQILKRPFRFKKNTPYQYSKLNATQKNDLYQQTRRKIKDVKAYMDELKENYNQIESMISSHLEQSQQMRNIPRKQYKVGYFCSKIQVAASSTLLEYLNKMIHLLLLIPEQLKKTHDHDEQYLENLDINLITFKISDLFRCKIKSREAQIIRIFREIKQISEKGQPFKIVRIKDRLNLGTRDILINILFMNTFLCEIQLAVEEYVDEKQVTYDSFSHFLYELHRSRLGPIMESACTWAQFDQRSKIFRFLTVDRINEQAHRYVAHNCPREYVVSNRYPFVCSICERFYSSQEGLLHHKRCNLCKTYFECSNCIYAKMDDMEIARLVYLPQKLNMFINQFKLWRYDGENFQMPKFGILTSRKMKKPSLHFFQTIIFRYDAYVIQILEGEKKEDDIKIDIIQKIVGNTIKGWQQLSEKYIIYEWKQKRNFNKSITPQDMLRAMQAERKKRQEQNNKRKQQKQKRRQELELKRKDKDDQQDDKQKEKEKENEKEKLKQKDKKKKKHKDDESSDSQADSLRKGYENALNQHGKDKKKEVYHETICQRNNWTKVRVIERQIDSTRHIFVLGIFLKEAVIRNKLKQMNNMNILHRISFEKIEVLFVEDEYIQNELNETNHMTEAEKNDLKETLERVSQVYLDNNFIKNIQFLSHMSTLKVAHLSHNNVEDLLPLQHNKNLTELVMENNNIESLEGLQNKPQILQINFNRNKLCSLNFFSEVEDDSFKKLKYLYLSGNEIQSLEGLEKLSNLIKLDLSFNQIKKLAPIKTLTHLQQLDLSENKIMSIKNISQFSNLRKLSLSENKIKNIPRAISELIYLNFLDLSANKIIRIINLNTGALSKNIRVLNLSDNQIQKMEGLDGMERLQVLKLSHNVIRQVDNYLDLSSLIYFDISHNCLTQLDMKDAIRYMPELRQVYLNSNPLVNNESNRAVLSDLGSHLKVLKYILKDYDEQFSDDEPQTLRKFSMVPGEQPRRLNMRERKMSVE